MGQGLGDAGQRAAEVAPDDGVPRVVLRPAEVALLVGLTELAARRDVPSHELLERGAERLARCLGDPCIASLLSEDGRWLHPVGLADPEPAVRVALEPLAGTRLRADRGFARRVLSTSRSLRLPDTSSGVIRAGRPELAVFVDRFPVHSLVVAPMRAHGRVLGHLAALRFRESGPLGERQEQLVQVVADLLALAIGGPRPSVVATASDTYAACEELTNREREVLALLADGHTNRETADRLVLSVRTVEWHRARIQWKLGVSGRAALVAHARTRGRLAPEQVP
jgi:DNA-binding CsgD family transcriptional regulator